MKAATGVRKMECSIDVQVEESRSRRKKSRNTRMAEEIVLA
jgi:hypothetical protein